jgi:hypothetical protein
MGKVYPGARNPNWKGGRLVASNGYVLVRVGVGHHLADVRRPGEPNRRIVCGCGCGAELTQYDRCGRPRRFVPGHNMRARRSQGG